MNKDYYPKQDAREEIDANLLGPCGFYCGFCLAFEKGSCLGCRYQAEKKEAEGEVEVFCDILACATGNGLRACAECPKHPCEMYDPKRSIFSELFINFLKTDVRKG